MDNLTHGLLGAAIGLLRRRGAEPPTPTEKAVLWASVLAAELPDLDVLLGRGPMDQYVYHRGLTHSLLFAPVVAGVATGVVKLIWREAKVAPVYAYSLLAVLLGHLVNDGMTGWGTRLLLPFSQARLGLDWVPIVDLLYTLPLLFCLLVGWRRPQLRHKLLVGVLTYLAVYTFGYRGISQSVVAAELSAVYAGEPVQQMRIAPDLFNPLAWQYTIDLPDRFEQGKAFAWGRVSEPRAIAKPPADEVVQAVRRAPALKPFFDQFSYVLIEYHQRSDGGYEVSLGDVRYRFGSNGLGTTVLLTPDLRVQEIH